MRINVPMRKRCPHCQTVKLHEEFAVDKSKSSGRKSWCLVCDREKARAYYADHREERAAYFADRNGAR